MISFKKIVTFIFLIFLLLSFAQITLAANETEDSSKTSTVSLTDPLTGTTGTVTSPSKIIGKVINAVLGLVGSLALAMFIYGGFMWMIAAGSPERVQKGKDIILWATIGLIVIFSSYALVKFVLDTLAKT